METIKKTQQSSDPRIDSPEIRVVYPAQTPATKELITPTVPIKEEVIAPVVSPSVTAEQPVTTEPSTVPVSWLDTIRQNTTVFLVVGAVLFGLGYLIGKNK